MTMGSMILDYTEESYKSHKQSHIVPLPHARPQLQNNIFKHLDLWFPLLQMYMLMSHYWNFLQNVEYV